MSSNEEIINITQCKENKERNIKRNKISERK